MYSVGLYKHYSLEYYVDSKCTVDNIRLTADLFANCHL